jgi:hypothetical protein
MLDDAADFFRDTYGGHMVHLTGLLVDDSIPAIAKAVLGEAAMAKDGFTVHGGVSEHSRTMALRPDLVSPSVTGAPAVTGKSVADLMRIARRADWPGYFGAPALASAALGEREVAAFVTPRVALALRILDGVDERTLPRYATMMATVPGIADIEKASAARDARIARVQQQWLARHRSAP